MDRKSVDDNFEALIGSEDYISEDNDSNAEFYTHEKPDKNAGESKRRKLEDYLEELRLKKELKDIETWEE